MDHCEIRDDIHAILSRLKIVAPGMACTRDYIEFNPRHEKPRLLKAWLIYRGYPETNILDDPTDQAITEIQRHGKPFAGFTNFDPDFASDEFLRIWLSWFGVGTKGEEKRSQLIETTRNILHLLRKLEKQEKPIVKFQKLINLQRQLRRKSNALSRLHVVLQGLEREVEESTRAEAKTQERQDQDKQTNEPSSMAWLLKMLFAKSLQATAVAVPIILRKTNLLATQPISKEGSVLAQLEKEVKMAVPSLVVETAVYTLYEPKLAAAVVADATNINQSSSRVLNYFAEQTFQSNPLLHRVLNLLFRRLFVIAKKVWGPRFAKWFEEILKAPPEIFQKFFDFGKQLFEPEISSLEEELVREELP